VKHLYSLEEKEMSMKFCEKCGNLLIVKSEDNQNFLFCRKCNIKYPLDEEIIIKTVFGNEKQIIVEDNKESNFPITKVFCPRCQSIEEAEWTLQQTRAADEPPTRFYRCKKCNLVWREYG
jgi:DNA-directed RNA polymerase subunit M